MLVGLTGGIASGKSEAARIFKFLGADILYADKISNDFLLDISTNRKDYFLNLLDINEDSVYLNGMLDKRKLGNIIFSQKDKKEMLENLIHPLVIEYVKDYASKNKSKMVVYESALLMQTGFFKDMDLVIFVTADPEIKLKRLIERNSLTEEEANIRLHSQIKQDDLEVNFVIDNSNSKEDLEKIVKEIYNVIKGKL